MPRLFFASLANQTANSLTVIGTYYANDIMDAHQKYRAECARENRTPYANVTYGDSAAMRYAASHGWSVWGHSYGG